MLSYVNSTDTPDLPARKILRRGPYRKIGGNFIFGKSINELAWESYHEDPATTALGLCSDVKSIGTQTQKVPYIDENCKPKYTIPDIELETTDGQKFFIEVKSWKFLIKAKNLEKYLAIQQSAKNMGYTYIFLVDLQIYQNPLYDKVLYLRRYLPRQDTLINFYSVIDLLNEVGLASIKSVVKTTKVNFDEVCIAIARGHICIDDNPPYSSNNLISLPDKPYRRISYASLLNQTWSNNLVQAMALGDRSLDQFKPVSNQEVGNKRILNAFNTGIC